MVLRLLLTIVMGIKNKISAFVFQPISIYPLVSFRIIFGLLMVYSTLRFVLLGWVENHYTDPVFHFKYYGFEWVEPLGIAEMYIVHIVMAMAALFVALGLWYRVASIVLFLTFTYTELIDLTYYLNHYYFVSIACFLLILLPANRHFSLDATLGRVRSATLVPAWTINCLKLMIAIVYIYAGLAKINTDWLIHALPLKIWLPAKDHLPFIGFLFQSSWLPYAFSWVGMIFDIFIIFFLLLPRTRWWAYAAVVFFHIMTGMLFFIGVFPYVMMSIVTIFFSPSWHQKFQSLIARILGIKKPLVTLSKPFQYPLFLRKTLPLFLAFFFAFQILFPWRYVLYNGNLFWTEEGYRFSWRVMLVEKAGTATFYVKDPNTGREGIVNNSDFLNPHQEKQMAFQPDMILQFAHFLGRKYQQKDQPIPQVRAEVYATLNGRPSRLLIRPDVNLMEIQDGWQQKEWILSL